MILMTFTLTAGIAMPQPPAAAHAMAPALCADDSGAWLTWLEPAPVHETATSDDIWRLQISHLDASSATWSPPQTITQRRTFFVNWADTPQVAAARNGDLYATWLQQSGPGTYAYDIGMARSTDRGETWTMLGTLNDDRVLGEHGFVSMVPEGDGVRAVWLDGRSMTGEGHDGHDGGDMSLRTSVISDTVQQSMLLDDRTCECCPTSLAAIEGGSIAVYRDRDADERRDMSAIHINRGDAPVHIELPQDDWVIAGCPVNGPSIASHGDQLAVAWYAGGEHPGVRVSRSGDQGQHWSTPQMIGTEDATGRPAVCWHQGHAYVCWIDRVDGSPALVWTHVGPDGHIAPLETVASVTAGRRSGYPRLTPMGKAVLAVWVDEDPAKGVSAAPLRRKLPLP